MRTDVGRSVVMLSGLLQVGGNVIIDHTASLTRLRDTELLTEQVEDFVYEC